MSGKVWIKKLAIVFLASCGAFTVSHVLFKLAVGRLYEVELIHWINLIIAAFFTLTTLIFYSRRPLTPRQFNKRIAIHGLVGVGFVALLYASGVFQFRAAENPALEATVSIVISAALYLFVAIVLIHQQREKVTSIEMNIALKRYLQKGRRRSRQTEGGDPDCPAAKDAEDET